MASESIITVENLGKHYQLGAMQSQENLRDVIARKARGLFRRAQHNTSNGTEAGEFWALRDVSFEIGRGEVVGIIGRNGAGKSTLLKILSRITEPTTGKVILRGRVASLLEVGTGFHPELTGRENIFLNGAILGMSRVEIKAKFDEIVAFAEVEKFLDTPVKRYSSGMYVRLAFAVAAHLEPEILIVDEVLAVGDAEFQKKCLGKMQDVAMGEGRTVIFVSHNMGALAQLCSSAIYLKSGVATRSTSVQQAISEYLSSNRTSTEGIFEYEGNPADKAICMTYAALRDSTGLVKASFAHNEPIEVYVEYTINRWVANADIGFNFDDHMSRRVFVTETSIPEAAAKTGRGIARATIPANLLVPGRYSVGLRTQVASVAMIHAAENSIAVTIVDAGSTYSRYMALDFGCVLVDGRWRTEAIAGGKHSQR